METLIWAEVRRLLKGKNAHSNVAFLDKLLLRFTILLP